MIYYRCCRAPGSGFQQDSRGRFQHVITRIGIGDRQRLSAGTFTFRSLSQPDSGHRLSVRTQVSR